MSTASAPYDMQIKLLMIGDSGVGKTCLLLRYANDSFSPTFITTIGIDFKIKNVEVDGTRISKSFWEKDSLDNRYETCGLTFFNLFRAPNLGHCGSRAIPSKYSTGSVLSPCFVFVWSFCLCSHSAMILFNYHYFT